MTVVDTVGEGAGALLKGPTHFCVSLFLSDAVVGAAVLFRLWAARLFPYGTAIYCLTPPESVTGFVLYGLAHKDESVDLKGISEWFPDMFSFYFPGSLEAPRAFFHRVVLQFPVISSLPEVVRGTDEHDNPVELVGDLVIGNAFGERCSDVEEEVDFLEKWVPKQDKEEHCDDYGFPDWDVVCGDSNSYLFSVYGEQSDQFGE